MLLKALRMNFAAAAFAFLFILPCLHAAWYDSIYVWIGFSAGAAIALIALAYMAAKLFELQVLEAWVKVELQEIMASMVIVVFCIS
ncbi:MAG: hypothetical protein N3F07_04010, partial [Candidatus Micrarchaeota archaeon]|nr:hypothetical protein [Candidatus Micrarchaeota archaeon]